MGNWGNRSEGILYISESPRPEIQQKRAFLNFIWILETLEHVEKLYGRGTLHSDKV